MNWSRKDIFRRLTYFIVSILMFTLTGCVGVYDDSTRGITGGQDPPPDPWEIAVEDALEVLDGDPDFESSLRSIQEDARAISDQIEVVEAAQPALDLLDDLRGIDIPFVGNAYDLLIKGLDAAQPGAGQALESIESGLRELLRVKSELDVLSSLDNLADASLSFRSSQSREDLVNLDAVIAQSRQGLEDVNVDLDSAAEVTSNIKNGITLVQIALRGAKQLSDTPYVGDVITSIHDALDDLNGTISTLQDSIEFFPPRDQIRSECDE